MKIIKYFMLFILISLSIFSTTSSISGTLKLGETNLGGVKLNFTDSSNHVFSTETDIYGDFSIKLPSKKYRIDINNYGYILEKNSNKIYDFSNSSENYLITLQAYERAASISGKVVDEDLNPIFNSKVTIKSSNITKIVHTDQFGNFKAEVPAGIFTVTSEYEEFIPSTIIKNIQMASSITNIKLILKSKRYAISGTITDGIHALSNIPVKIYTEKGELIATFSSTENGYYEFLDLKGNSKVFILVNSPDYKEYQSENIKISDNIKDNIITLNSK